MPRKTSNKLFARIREAAQAASDTNDAVRKMKEKRDQDLYEIEQKNKAEEEYYKTHKRTPGAAEAAQNKLITEAYDRGIQRLEIAMRSVRDAHDAGVDRLAEALGKPSVAEEGDDFMSPNTGQAAEVAATIRSLTIKSTAFADLSSDKQKLVMGYIHDAMVSDRANSGLSPDAINAKIKAEYTWVDGRKTRPLARKIADQIAYDDSHRGAARTPPPQDDGRNPIGDTPGR